MRGNVSGVDWGRVFEVVDSDFPELTVAGNIKKREF